MLLHEFHGAADVLVDADPAEVFASVTDIGRLPAWNAHIRRVLEDPEKALADGVEWVVLMSAMGTTWRSRSRVSLHDPVARRFEHITHTDDGNPTWLEWRWRVDPASTGGTRLAVTWSGHPRTFWRKAVFAKIRRRQLAAEVPTSLAALAHSLVPAPRPSS
jgi:hypothetical protein